MNSSACLWPGDGAGTGIQSIAMHEYSTVSFQGALIDLVIAPLMVFRLLASASLARAAMHVAERRDTHAHLSSRHQHIDFCHRFFAKLLRCFKLTRQS